MTRIRFAALLAALAIIDPCAGLAQTPSLEELWLVVQRQAEEIDELKRRLGDAEAEVATTSDRIGATEAQLESTDELVAATTDYVETLAVNATTPATTISGYGELHYNDLSAEDPARDVEQIDYHRFVLFVGRRLSDRIRFFSELELEHSLAGDGAPGEIELEQAYVDFQIGDSLFAQTGLFLLPLGILNETHEPPTFYGVERNDVESIIIPTTWWEAGGGLSGNLSNGLSWNFAVHSGLAMPTTGSSAFRVRSGRQKVAEALASDTAYTGRLRYTGIPGLELSASYQYQSDPSQIAGDGLDSGRLFTAHAILTRGRFGLRSLYGRWDFDGLAVEQAGDDRQTGWFIEPSYRITDRWGIYTRYEDLEGARDVDEFDQWEVGFNYWPTSNVVLKLDYRQRNYSLAALAARDFDGIDLGMGYQF